MGKMKWMDSVLCLVFFLILLFTDEVTHLTFVTRYRSHHPLKEGLSVVRERLDGDGTRHGTLYLCITACLLSTAYYFLPTNSQFNRTENNAVFLFHPRMKPKPAVFIIILWKTPTENDDREG